MSFSKIDPPPGAATEWEAWRTYMNHFYECEGCQSSTSQMEELMEAGRHLQAHLMEQFGGPHPLHLVLHGDMKMLSELYKSACGHLWFHKTH